MVLADCRRPLCDKAVDCHVVERQRAGRDAIVGERRSEGARQAHGGGDVAPTQIGRERARLEQRKRQPKIVETVMGKVGNAGGIEREGVAGDSSADHRAALLPGRTEIQRRDRAEQRGGRTAYQPRDTGPAANPEGAGPGGEGQASDGRAVEIGK